MSEGEGEATNVCVMVRVRPFNKREKKISEQNKERLQSCVSMRGTTCAILEHTVDSEGFTHEREREAFEFDHCFWSMPFEQCPTTTMEFATQVFVYERSGKVALDAAFGGFNCCIFAYGQTGSGKTHSMLGSDDDPGISPRLVDDLFKKLNDTKGNVARGTSSGKVECMFFEIYNEKVRDLFNKHSKAGEYANPRIRQHPTKGVYVEGLERKLVADAETAKDLIKKGTLERAMAETKMNAHSSRSHAIFQIQVTQNHPLKGTQTSATINLVDLAGSEKIKMSGVSGAALKEAMNINQSLSTLRRVIDTLIDNSTSKRQKVPPFRESVLTYCLSDSLGGNSKTQMIATISPHESNLEDTLGTLRYALRAKAIVCNARVNEEKSAEMVDAMKDEIARLKQQMREGGGGGGGGGGEASPELLAEIAEKEEEFKRMEEDQNRMEEEAEEMKKKLAEVDQAKQELTIAINEQKRDKFANAFRQAFLIQQDKKKIELNEKEIIEARTERDSLRQRNKVLQADIEEKISRTESLQAQNDYLNTQLEDERNSNARSVGSLELRSRELQEMKDSLERRLKGVADEIVRLREDKEDREATIERLQADLVGLTHAVERENIEKNNMKRAFEKEVVDSNSKVDAMRRRKEHYKQALAEEETKTRALKDAVKLHINDREALLETIRAQQKIISEKEFLVDNANRGYSEARDKFKKLSETVAAKDEKVSILNEALSEYQSASTQWMKDLSIKDREVSRLRGVTEEVRQMVEGSGSPVRARSPLTPRVSSPVLSRQNSTMIPGASPVSVVRTPSSVSMSASRSSPRRAQSPTLASRTPHFHQPRVDRKPPQTSMSPAKPRWTSPVRNATPR